jgi:hypothetical protein
MSGVGHSQLRAVKSLALKLLIAMPMQSWYCAQYLFVGAYGLWFCFVFFLGAGSAMDETESCTMVLFPVETLLEPFTHQPDHCCFLIGLTINGKLGKWIKEYMHRNGKCLGAAYGLLPVINEKPSFSFFLFFTGNPLDVVDVGIRVT